MKTLAIMETHKLDDKTNALRQEEIEVILLKCAKYIG
jgi:hypothetical protein